MPPYVSDTIIWISVLAFLACVLAGILMIFGVLEPKDPAVRKWLLRGVLVVVVGAVAQFAARQFGSGSQQHSRQTPHQSALESGATRTPTPTQPGRVSDAGPGNAPAKRDSGAEGQPALPQVTPIPSDLQTWAAKTLGPRPLLPSDAEQRYPRCVAQFANAATAVESSDATDCRRELQKFHMDVIVSYYDTKRPYDHNLEAQETNLRKGGVQAEELAKYNYILAEMDRLNGEDSVEADAVRSLEGRVLADIHRCTKSACR